MADCDFRYDERNERQKLSWQGMLKVYCKNFGLVGSILTQDQQYLIVSDPLVDMYIIGGWILLHCKLLFRWSFKICMVKTGINQYLEAKKSCIALLVESGCDIDKETTAFMSSAANVGGPNCSRLETLHSHGALLLDGKYYRSNNLHIEKCLKMVKATDVCSLRYKARSHVRFVSYW